jgi:oxygen-dependent protoporphyrinogen oxidase
MRVIVIGGGISGLAAGYWLAERSRAAGDPIDVRVLEASERAGGHVRTVHERGYVVEAGPNGWLDREPAARALLRDLGLEDRVIEARPAARKRYIVRGGRLCRVPDSPAGLVSSPALSAAGKLRLLVEPFAAGPPEGTDESVFEFAERRIGREAAEYLVDAAISGISAGDSRRLSVRAAFPIMTDMEREHGSLIRAMMARRKAGVGPTRLVSLDRGLGLLVETLEGALGTRLSLGTSVLSLEREGNGYRLRLAGGDTLAADQIVLAIPAWRAAPVLAGLNERLAAELETIPGAGVSVVALAYRASDLSRPLDGYGYLVTRGEGSSTLGVVWDSSLFDGRAPQGAVLVRAIVGGARTPGCVTWHAEQVERRVRAELAPLLGVTAEPLRSWVFRRPSAIPQYERGHLERAARIRAAVEGLPGLHLCGTSYDGVSFSAGIASADRFVTGFLANSPAPAAPAPERELVETP